MKRSEELREWGDESCSEGDPMVGSNLIVASELAALRDDPRPSRAARGGGGWVVTAARRKPKARKPFNIHWWSLKLSKEYLLQTGFPRKRISYYIERAYRLGLRHGRASKGKR